MKFPSEDELVEFYSAIARSSLLQVKAFIGKYPVGSQGIQGVLQLGLSFAALVSNPQMMTFLLENGALIDGHDEDGDTALVAAVRMNKPDSVSFLLSAGADACRASSDGAVPLDVARMRGHDAIVSMLEEHIASLPPKPVENSPDAREREAELQRILRQKKPKSPFGGKGGPKI